MHNTVFMFPGQGGQYVGMGKSLYESSKKCREIFEIADQICHTQISKICFEGPIEELTNTENLQPAIAAVHLCYYFLLEEKGITPSWCAGHSVGEYAALAAAGVISMHDAILLTRMRGTIMQREADLKPGGMLAVVGLLMSEVEQIVQEAGKNGNIDIANHNTAKQIVITGENEALAAAATLIKDKKAKAIPLKVSGAWHSRLMENGVSELRNFLNDIKFSSPKVTFISNATARPENDPEKLKDILAGQLVSPVYWYDSMTWLIQQGAQTFVEVGPGKILSGILEKILTESGSGNEIKIINETNLSEL